MYAKKLQTEEQSTITLQHEKPRGISINKYLADAGVSSRRGAEVIIKDLRVKIDGTTAKLGDRVQEGQSVTLDGVKLNVITEKLYLILNKPEGIVCTTENVENNIVTFMNLDETVFPVGRLDKDSSGLIIMTNDGDIVNKILRNEYGHEKEYLVRVDKDITPEDLEHIRNGVVIYNQKKNTYQLTDPCQVTLQGSDVFSIILKQGMNRQIRRMTLALNYHVVSLERIRVMHLTLEDIPVGYYRSLSTDELVKLKEQLQDVK